MSSTDKDRLLESLHWSGREYTLDQLLEDYTLPQVVCIKDGHYGEKVSTSLSTGQVLTLHALSSRKILVGDDCNGKPLTVSLDCPVKVHVYPPERADFQQLGVQAGQVVSVFPGVRYVKALKGYMNVDDEEESFEMNDVLEIKEIDKEASIIRCRNTTSKGKLSLTLECTSLLTPLLDYKEYTVAEVKEKFDLPAKVSFISTGDELSQSLSTVGSIILLGEIDEAVVISTTVGGTSEDKFCHFLPKDLDVNVCVAEGLVSGDKTYETIVRNLHDDVRLQDLFDSDKLAVYRAREAVHKFVQPTREDFFDQKPSKNVIRKHAEMRVKHSKGNTPPPRPPKPNSSDHFRQSSSSALPRSSSHHSSPPVLPPRVNKKKPSATTTTTTTTTTSQYSNVITLQSKCGSASKSDFNDTDESVQDAARPTDIALQITDPMGTHQNSNAHTGKTSSREWTTSTLSNRWVGRPSGLSTGDANSELTPDHGEPGHVDEKKSKKELSMQKTTSLPSLGVHQRTSKCAGLSTDITISKLTQENPNPDPLYDKIDEDWKKKINTGHENLPTAAPDSEVYTRMSRRPRLPADLSGVTVEGVGELLKNLNMERYAAMFMKETIDGELLKCVDEECLRSLHMEPFDCKKLVMFINGWRP